MRGANSISITQLRHIIHTVTNHNLYNLSGNLNPSHSYVKKSLLVVTNTYEKLSTMTNGNTKFPPLYVKCSAQSAARHQPMLATARGGSSEKREDHFLLLVVMPIDLCSCFSSTLHRHRSSMGIGMVEKSIQKCLNFIRVWILKLGLENAENNYERLKDSKYDVDIINILGRSYLLGCVPMLVKQNYFACTLLLVHLLHKLQAFALPVLTHVMLWTLSWILLWKVVHIPEMMLNKMRIHCVTLNAMGCAIVWFSCKSESESWSSKCKEGITVNEAKRSVLPVKFYLINAVRIMSQRPCKVIYKDITQCVLMISTLGISLSREPHLKASSEALVEFLEPTSCCLLHTLLISDEVEQEAKFKILDWLFTDEKHSSCASPGEANRSPTFMEEVFTLNCDNMPRDRALILGQVSLFLNLLRSSPDLKEDGIIGISQKLEWFFHCLIDEDVYSSILVLKIPVFLSRVGSSPVLVWQCLFSSLLLALKVFVVVAAPSVAWGNVEFFLLESFLHPHFLIWEINMELWCFIVRGAELEMANDIMCKLCSLFKLMASFRPFPANICALRKMARSICVLLSYATQPSIDQVYCFISNDRSPAACIMYVALLMEGFPLKSLSDGLKKHAIHRIISSYHSFIEKNEKKLQIDGPSRSLDSNILCAPVYAISSALQYHQINSADVNEKTLKFMISIINGYKGATGVLKEAYCKLLSKSLAIVSNAKHLYASDVMQEVILELQTLFGTKSIASDVLLDLCKPDLSFFMAGLAHMDIKEDEGSSIYSALWEMYGMLLRERHWANIHLAISAFGYFAARTSCNQLWRFVPQDAALSFDPSTGNVTEDRFMSELKAFLDKEGAVILVTPSTEQYAILVKEALILKETVDKISNIKLRDSSPDIMEMDSESHVTKKRKLPDGISEGVVLLQSGLKVMGDGLAQLQQQQHGSHDLHEKFSTQLLRLEDVIYHLVGLAGDE
ncbi:hypothetical protein Sjap_008714 [Stephania japonica]|uniref:Uncharacterized protein n=1 Tax=Stephania japonica TaxID=461633 RepID=A0AAP0JSB9_9MAGN